MENAHRNLAVAHLLRRYDILTDDPRVLVDGYIRQCSVLVTTRDLAMMAATLANRGVNPLTGDQVVEEPVVRQVLSVMATCGMYDAAGDWATQVGIPANSGVAGGLIGALPGQIASRPTRPGWTTTATAPGGPQCSNDSPPIWACTSWRFRPPRAR
jgi:glutaminase